MNKIPTLFKREYDNHRVINITNVVTPGMEWVINGEGEATVKIDVACCAIINGIFYKRYDAKNGKNPPKDGIPCCDPDPITGHWPHWVPIDDTKPEDKWFMSALKSTLFAESLLNPSDLTILPDGTYEAIGKHFNGNPYHGKHDFIVKHGEKKIEVPRTFEGIRDYLANHEIEGIVFWKDGEPQCKIKRSDFGIEWPVDNPLEVRDVKR